MQGLDTVFAISCGIATIYALDGLISYFDLQADGFGEHGHGHGHTSSTPTPILPIPSVSPQGKSKPRAEHGAAQAARARSALLTTLALAAHNAPEGLAVGMASLQESTPAAVAADGANTAGAAGPDASQHTALVVFAIGLHNIPEGIAVREHVDTKAQRPPSIELIPEIADFTQTGCPKDRKSKPTRDVCLAKQKQVAVALYNSVLATKALRRFASNTSGFATPDYGHAPGIGTFILKH
jgi:hypothetical protein